MNRPVVTRYFRWTFTRHYEGADPSATLCGILIDNVSEAWLPQGDRVTCKRCLAKEASDARS